MARVFLINPPSPEPVRTPLLSFCHLAAALRAGGHDGALLDASAPHAPHTAAEIAARVAGSARISSGCTSRCCVQPVYALTAALAASFERSATGWDPDDSIGGRGASPAGS